jgi:hypothetical protein
MKKILMVVFLMHQLSQGTASRCSWFVDSVKWDKPLQTPSIVGNTVKNIDTTSEIENIDIPTLLLNPPKVNL